MSFYRISMTPQGPVLGSRVKLADTFWTRFAGLMMTSGMDGFDGILFQFRPGNSIHTCFMRYPIDVVFLTSNNEVVKVIRSMKPWRFTRPYFKATQALELMAGTVPGELSEGMQLEVTHV